jgi:DNA-binding NarL/FixJ family response regulator
LENSTRNGVIQMSPKESKVNFTIFTQRELEVLTLIAEGYKNKEIANNLNMSLKTVERYLDQLRKKTNLHDIPSLLDYAFEKKALNLYEFLESHFQKRKLKQMKGNQEIKRA